MAELDLDAASTSDSAGQLDALAAAVADGSGEPVVADEDTPGGLPAGYLDRFLPEPVDYAWHLEVWDSDTWWRTWSRSYGSPAKLTPAAYAQELAAVQTRHLNVPWRLEVWRADKPRDGALIRGVPSHYKGALPPEVLTDSAPDTGGPS